jgi:hypothetical protein
MQNLTLSTYTVNQHFEQEKNRKAALYTLIAVIVVIAILLIRITLPVVQEPVVDNGIEVNLGNSDFGSGDIPPMVPGEPAPESSPQQEAAVPPAARPVVEESEEEADPTDKEPAPTKTVEKVKPAEKSNRNPPIEKPEVVKEKPAPPQPKPKAAMPQYSGGKGPGGNNQDTYNGVKDQGIAGGKGDQGKPNGNINSDNYKGNGGTGTGGVTVVRGNRSVVRATKLQGEFTHNATLYVDVKVDEGGTGTFLKVTKGLNESQFTNIIKQRLASRDIQFSNGDEESIVNIMIVFKVN